MGCLILWCSWESIGLVMHQLHRLYPNVPVFCSCRSKVLGERGEAVAVMAVPCPGEGEYELFNQLMADGYLFETSWSGSQFN